MTQTRQHEYAPWTGPFYFKYDIAYEPEKHKVPDRGEGQPFAVWVVTEQPADPILPVYVVVDIYFFRWRIFHKRFEI